MADPLEEYDIHRGQISLWIQIECTLYGLTATTVAAALGFFDQKKPGSWPLFSSGLLFLVACLGFYIAFSRAKLMVVSALCKQRFKDFADWEVRLPGVFAWLHECATLLFFTVIFLSSIIYPASNDEKWLVDMTNFKIVCLSISCCIYFVMVGLNMKAYHRAYFESSLSENRKGTKPAGVIDGGGAE